MISEILMPRLSETADTGTIAAWLVAPGDRVEKGQVVLHIETDKAIVETESPAAGTVLKVFFGEGETVQARTVLALLGEAGESLPALDPLHHVQTPQADQRPARQPEHAPVQRRASGGVNISPAAQRRAEELGVDLSAIQGSGPYGRIMKEDVQRAAAQVMPVPEGSPTADMFPLSRMRRAVAANMLASVQTAPHAFVETEMDVTELVDWREKLRGEAGAGGAPGYTALFVQAAAGALRAFPRLNAALQGESLAVWHEVNIGVAVALEDGLIVVVIHTADRLTLLEIEQTIRDLAEKAAGGRLPIEALTGGTFTVSNLGMYGADNVLSIINAGQAGTLSIGRIRRRPAVHDDQIAIRALVRMTLSFDHRIVDGALAARFLAYLEESLAHTGLRRESGG